MKFYEFVVIKGGWMMGSFARKMEALAYADSLRNKYPDSEVAVKANVYGKPLDAYDVGDSYLYSYDVH